MIGFVWFTVGVLILTAALCLFIVTLCVPAFLYMISRPFWPGCTILWDHNTFGITLAREPGAEETK
jgi:hypothetical protein